uniref:Cyclic GMP-AMP synthase DncV-like nucleotidyltransferase domain-containing protein n=1 Tax=Rhizophagus irregularis (strain DAOM 181602 / DAOM 197198 / MUCL 43194) TaxID=747089 RepID=U9UHG2_RHIID
MIGEGSEAGIDAVDVKNDLHEAILEFCDFKKNASVPVETKDRCERVVFTNHFHIDLPLYYFDSIAGEAVLATANGWEHSDPKGFQDWFESAVDQDRRPYVRRMIKYLKSWAALKALSGKVKLLPSMAFTILVAEFVNMLSCSDDEMDFSNLALQVTNRLDYPHFNRHFPAS